MRRLTTPLLAVLLTTACSSAAATPTPTLVATATPSPTPAPITPSPFPSDDQFAKTVRTVAGGEAPAGSDLDEYWSWLLDTAYARAEPMYHPPSKVAAYRAGSVPDTICARGLAARLWINNARYCESDAGIYFDEDWLRKFSANAGPIAADAILAHEWGHHIQALEGTTVSNGERSIQIELQADCYAGVFLGSREEEKGGIYVVGTDQLTSALVTFFNLGDRDYAQDDSMSAGVHGSRNERMLSFSTGFLGSIGNTSSFGRVTSSYPWCYGYRDYVAGSFTAIGPYRLINPPGRPPTANGDVVSVPAETRVAHPTSTIELTFIPVGTDAADYLRQRFPDLQTLLTNEQLGGPMHTSAGDITHSYVQWHGPRGTRSGFHGYLAGAPNGVLSIVVFRDEPPVTSTADTAGMANLAEEVAAIAEIAGRLCTPSESAEVSSPSFSTSCANDQ